MKKAEIKVGGHYIAKVSGRIVTVRVDAIRECGGYDHNRPVYDVTNLTTGRKTTFRSAAKFRSEIGGVNWKPIPSVTHGENGGLS